MSITTHAAIARGPHTGWGMVDLKLDEPKAHEVRVKFCASGLCHSDNHITKGDARPRVPIVGGHEGAGIVESVRAAGVRAGDTVVIFGAGGVGSSAVQGDRYAGAKNVIVVDPVEFKRDTAKIFGATQAFATAGEAHEFVVETTWGQLADHAILTPAVVTEEMVNAATAMTGKGGQGTITAGGHIDEHAVHVPAGMLIGYQRQIRRAPFW